MQTAAGRLYFEMPNNAKKKGPWNGYVCSGTAIADGVNDRSMILTAADCIQGKRVTTVPKCQMDAEQGGACYVDQDVVLDGKLITGRGYAENTEVLKAFLRLLNKS